MSRCESRDWYGWIWVAKLKTVFSLYSAAIVAAPLFLPGGESPTSTAIRRHRRRYKRHACRLILKGTITRSLIGTCIQWTCREWFKFLGLKGPVDLEEHRNLRMSTDFNAHLQLFVDQKCCQRTSRDELEQILMEHRSSDRSCHDAYEALHRA